MIAAGMALVWIGYGFGVWGWSLMKGYDLGPGDIWSPVRFYQGHWPPPPAPPDKIIPKGSGPVKSGQQATATAAAASPLAPGRKRT